MRYSAASRRLSSYRLIKLDFTDIDGFIARAQTILQSRKSRSGRSLELHACQIFTEEKLVEGSDFSHQKLPTKTPHSQRTV